MSTTCHLRQPGLPLHHAGLSLLALGLSLSGLVPLASAQTAVNEWVYRGPEGGLIAQIAINPVDSQIIYARGYQLGLYKSSDSGESWRLRINADGHIYVDPRSPSTLYVATASCGPLVKSTDDGETWTSGIGLPCGGGRIVFDPTQAGVLYLFSVDNNIYKSMDSGGTWTTLGTTGINGRRATTVVHDPTTRDKLYAGTPDGLFKSLDGANSWTAMPSVGLQPGSGRPEEFVGDGPPVGQTLVINGGSPSTLYAVVANCCTSGLFRTRDSGATWQEITPSEYVLQGGLLYSIVLDPVTPTTAYLQVYHATQPARFKSTDEGTTWTRVSGGSFFLAVDPLNPNVFYSGQFKWQGDINLTPTVFKSTDGGATWEPKRRGLRALGIYAASPLVHPSTRTLFFTQNGLHASTDDGASWAERNTGLDFLGFNLVGREGVVFDPDSSSTLYRWGVGSLFFKSADLGMTWTLIKNLTECGEAHVLVPDRGRPNGVFAACRTGLFHSLDGGTTWTSVLAAWVHSVAIHPTDPNTVYAASPDQGLFRSTDGGGTWSSIPTGLANSILEEVAIDPVTPTTLYLSDQVNGILKSTNGGGAWQRMGIPRGGDLVIDPLDPSILYTNSTIRSTDGGFSWSNLPGNMAVNPGQCGAVSCLILDPQSPNVLYGTGGHVFYRPPSPNVFTTGHGLFSMFLAPVIECLSPTSGNPGDTVSITGKFFRPTQRTSAVTFNGTTAPIVNWSETQLQVQVPAGASTGPVEITLLADPRLKSVVQPNSTCSTLPQGSTTATFTVLTIPVTIDIKPGSFPNSINLGSGGTVPVAIFSSSTFDATRVDPLTVTLASAPVQLKGKGTAMASAQDVNGDGLLDLVVHVQTEALQINETDTAAELLGKTLAGQSIRGTDSVRVVP